MELVYFNYIFTRTHQFICAEIRIIILLYDFLDPLDYNNYTHLYACCVLGRIGDCYDEC